MNKMGITNLTNELGLIFWIKSLQDSESCKYEDFISYLETMIKNYFGKCITFTEKKKKAIWEIYFWKESVSSYIVNTFNLQ